MLYIAQPQGLLTEPEAARVMALKKVWAQRS